MVKIHFNKYSATGNDFIVIDNRESKALLAIREGHNSWAERLCDRKQGVGADGVLLMEKSKIAPFKMRYLNADGQEVSMCGNGARSILHFAKTVGLDALSLDTINGIYFGEVLADDFVKIKIDKIRDISLINLDGLERSGNFKRKIYLNTGVPHVVLEVDELEKIDLFNIGKKIRNNPLFQEGTNVNFVERTSTKANNEIKIRTYERGVENETLSCGTGAVAAAYATTQWYGFRDKVKLIFPGGELFVTFDSSFSNVFLSGPVQKIFEGELDSHFLSKTISIK